MVLLQSYQDITNPDIQKAFDGLRSHLDRQSRLGLLLYDKENAKSFWELQEHLARSIPKEQGQFISLNIEDMQEVSLPNLFRAALEDWRDGVPFRINLPIILRNNPKTDSPFINRAILWQRLCDRLIEDEDPDRPTLLILDNFDQGNPQTCHELNRLIRFHSFHRIRRTFVLAMPKEEAVRIAPEWTGQLDFQTEFCSPANQF